MKPEDNESQWRHDRRRRQQTVQYYDREGRAAGSATTTDECAKARAEYIDRISTEYQRTK